jgi:hypothetical protein
MARGQVVAGVEVQVGEGGAVGVAAVAIEQTPTPKSVACGVRASQQS